jgi:hypothetical protein
MFSLEVLEPLHIVLHREMAKLRNCTRLRGQSETVSLYDGTVAEMPLLRWADVAFPSCWPAGSDSNISRDFLVRGVYYPQLVQLFRTVPRVSTVCEPRPQATRWFV